MKKTIVSLCILGSIFGMGESRAMLSQGVPQEDAIQISAHIKDLEANGNFWEAKRILDGAIANKVLDSKEISNLIDRIATPLLKENVADILPWLREANIVKFVSPAVASCALSEAINLGWWKVVQEIIRDNQFSALISEKEASVAVADAEKKIKSEESEMNFDKSKPGSRIFEFPARPDVIMFSSGDDASEMEVMFGPKKEITHDEWVKRELAERLEILEELKDWKSNKVQAE